VLISGIDTTEALVVTGQRAAGGERVLAIPYDYEHACDEAPDVCLGVPYFNWGPGYLERIKAVQDGTWEPQFVWDEPDWDDLNNRDTSPIGFLKGPALTDEWAASVDTFIAGLADGSINLFVGPLNYQDGSTFLADGEVATDDKIWYMEQLLEGMEGPSE
jgi:simple sugar transport system substrate-binding protein